MIDFETQPGRDARAGHPPLRRRLRDVRSIPAYRRGVADSELGADAGVARSLIPPGTAATRDFSALAPRIPDFLPDACVGCMTCVNACPDTAILAVAMPEPEIADRGRGLCRRDRSRRPALAQADRHRRATSRTRRNTPSFPSARARAPARFGIFVDPVHCKGCG